MRAIKMTLIGLMTFLLTAFPIFWVFSGPVEKARNFESEDWKKSLLLIYATNDPGCIRGGMAVDLISNKRLVGFTQVQVAALLGNPQESHLRRWLYSLGQCGFAWGFSNLRVDFGTNGVVTNAAID